jgi:hypothetical protein
LIPYLKHGLKEAFGFTSGIDLQFTKDLNMVVTGNKKVTISGCWFETYHKDTFLCICLRNIHGLPLAQNIAFLRNLIITFQAGKIDYEIW